MKGVAGSIIAFVLLVLYGYSAVKGVLVVRCESGVTCTAHPLSDFTDGMTLVLTAVGGLVSALVIAELAITPPNKLPAAFAVRAGWQEASVTALTTLYILGWLATGLAAFVVGVMQHPKILQPITDVGQAWLGLAVAAGYSYFGIKPPAARKP